MAVNLNENDPSKTTAVDDVYLMDFMNLKCNFAQFTTSSVIIDRDSMTLLVDGNRMEYCSRSPF